MPEWKSQNEERKTKKGEVSKATAQMIENDDQLEERLSTQP